MGLELEFLLMHREGDQCRQSEAVIRWPAPWEIHPGSSTVCASHVLLSEWLKCWEPGCRVAVRLQSSKASV